MTDRDCDLCHGNGTVETAPYFPGPLGYDPQQVYDVPCPRCDGSGVRDPGDECRCKACA